MKNQNEKNLQTAAFITKLQRWMRVGMFDCWRCGGNFCNMMSWRDEYNYLHTLHVWKSLLDILGKTKFCLLWVWHKICTIYRLIQKWTLWPIAYIIWIPKFHSYLTIKIDGISSVRFSITKDLISSLVSYNSLRFLPESGQKMLNVVLCIQASGKVHNWESFQGFEGGWATYKFKLSN